MARARESSQENSHEIRRRRRSPTHRRADRGFVASCFAAQLHQSRHGTTKHTIKGSNGELKITDKTGMEMVKEVRNKEKVTPVSERKEEITILDIDGDVASVKLVATPLDRLHDAFEAEWRVEDCFGCKEKPRVIRLITSAIAQRSRKDLTNR